MQETRQDSDLNYFELFNLPATFSVDSQLLDINYRKLQSEVHPDRFVTASSAERMKSMQMATLANDAYQTLKQPLSKARYLLKLAGIATDEENNTAMPADFLMLQMEWRETIEDARNAKDIDALDNLLNEIAQNANTLQQTLKIALDETNDLELAADTVRKLSFIEKLREDVSQSIEKLEN
ncbi:Fe-S protein assembly co-chaperone HscB [Methyloradius palustris]|uniref:Co-chaperone protein HscB homolog n=1 Tax=Methyloradius palustris TaxID=2778876 RepID=A0A8D5G9S1_9PROT|nr:Fe-S protein assembly co-chaperone HscB [Methyloradius palustris]BCM25671.1 co-chaperone protein HscB [Methyloradius palustris]